ncbi:pro-resilin [Procambarus clarkii]|uniref:pro-resilin n=1 Tax=Procambarus clarkii TaxID=6728 RepID=UPI001E676EE2|nr:pro-resilin-like [Procambarus clarkii]
MNWKEAVLVLCVATRVAADTSFSYNPPFTQVSTQGAGEASEAKYSFEWRVDHDPSSNEYGHEESRDGDDTQGRYFVVLPDGRLQQVVFTVSGSSGYKPRVTYEGSIDSLESVESVESDDSDEFEEQNASDFQEFDSASEED